MSPPSYIVDDDYLCEKSKPQTAIEWLIIMQTLFIKNMVCPRCIMVVRNELDELKIPYASVQLGEVELKELPDSTMIVKLHSRLDQWGFELLDDKKSLIIEKIKNTIVTAVHGSNIEFNLKLSAILIEKLQLDYHYISTLFSNIEGITIEKYAILQRIEKVKELMMYEEKSLSEIAEELGYSSVQHLSQQFKKVTGLTPSHFKQLKENKRKPLDQVK